MRWGLWFLRLARQFRSSLHRILHRFFEVVIGDLKVVFHGYGLGVANPVADDMKPA